MIIIGIIIILYFALFNNKEHPDSLGKRLSKDRIQNNIEEIKGTIRPVIGSVIFNSIKTIEYREVRKNFGMIEILKQRLLIVKT